MYESTPVVVGWNTSVSIGVSNGPNNPPTMHDDNYSGSATFSSWRSGGSVPDFRRKIAEIRDATSSFEGNKVKVKQTGFNFRVEWNTAPAGYHSIEAASGLFEMKGLPDRTIHSTTDADNQAKMRVLSAASKRRAAFQGGVFLAELRQTIRGIRQPLRSLREGLDAYHKRAKKLSRKGSRAGFQSALSGTWLEFQFGFLQNARDIENGLAALKLMSKDRSLYFKANGTSSSTSLVGKLYGAQTYNVSSGHLYQTRRTESVIVIYRGAYKAKLPYGWDLDSWGVNTQDFIPAVWEAIPYSFVVDYFTNIGKILEAYSGILCDIAWVAKTIRTEVSYHQYGTGFYVANPGIQASLVDTGSPGSIEIALTAVQRFSSSVNGLIPQFTLKVPDAGSLSWLNLAALIRLKTL